MTENIFWAGIVAPFLGIIMLVFLVRDFRKGESEPLVKLLFLAGFKEVKRVEKPGKFWLLTVLNFLAILVLLVIAPLWAFGA